MTVTTSTLQTDTFRQDTTKVCSRLRTAFSRAFGSFGVDGVLKSRELQRRLGIDVRLAWQVTRIVNAKDPLDLCAHVPSQTLLQKALRAGSKQGIPQGALDAINEAYAAYEEHIERYAGDRESFDTIVAPIVGGDTDAALEQTHRRAIFEGHRYVWGVELDLHVIANIVHPSLTEEGLVDTAVVRVRHHLRRLHTQLPIVVEIKKSMTQEFVGGVQPPRAPLDAEAYARYGFPILPEFCSRPDLPIQSAPLPTGGLAVEYMADTVGRPSTVTFAFGDVDEGKRLLEWPDGKRGIGMMCNFSIPTRASVFDLLVHRPTFGAVTPEVKRFGHASNPLLLGRRESDPELPLPELSCREQVTFLGSGDAAIHLHHMPRYGELIRRTCQVRGWNVEEFDVYRIRMEYPMLDTLVAINYYFEQVVR